MILRHIIFNKRGMTIVGAMVSCLLLTVGVLALMKIFPQSTLIDTVADRLSIAVNLAEDKIEEVRAVGYDTLYTALTDSLGPGYEIGVDTVGKVIREYTLVPDIPYDDVIQITVRCYWKNPSRQDSSTIQVVTLLSSFD